MGWRRVVHRLPLAGAATAGAAVGHSIAYLIVAPQGRTRAMLMAGTGHGYWSTAVAAEIVLGLLVAAGIVARHLHLGLRRGPRPPAESPWSWLALRLVLLQSSIFTVQEALERTVSGHPASMVVGDRLLLVGLLVQVAVALVVATLLLWLGRAAEAVGRALAGVRPPRRHAGVRIVWPVLAVRPASRPRGVRGSRAPPRPWMA